MWSRRTFLQSASVLATGLMGPWSFRARPARAETCSAPVLLDAGSHDKFQVPLPLPRRIDATAGGNFNIEMQQTAQWLGLRNGNGEPLLTPVWGYGAPGKGVSYPGPTFVAKRDMPVKVNWRNKLPYAHLLPIDDTIHLAQPKNAGIPTVTHLHGGHTESGSDGLPEAWFTQGYGEHGPTWRQVPYRYDNDQEAATLWYHDHALGITRLNVYAGLAGFYLLRDDNESRLIEDGVLPSGPYEIEVVIQDRMFRATGELFLPSTVCDPGGEELPEDVPDPSIIAEFFGDFILVNGAAWPYLDVEPTQYRLRLLNGSDSRFYVLQFGENRHGGPTTPVFQIGTDDGLLPHPVPIEQLVIAPGERTDLVVDFSKNADRRIVLRNFGPDEPFKGTNQSPADSETTGKIVEFRVQHAAAKIFSLDEYTWLRSEPLPDIAAVAPAKVRRLALFEGEDDRGRLQPLLGVAEPTFDIDGDLVNGSLAWFEAMTETPELNAQEIWEVYNTTEDAHPIHLHLVTFRILGRQRFRANVLPKPQRQHDGSFGIGAEIEEGSIKLLGQEKPPEPNETGLKDTAIMFPGEVTRIVAKFDRPGRYVWHCHILSHEDHEMMRPYEVISEAVAAAGG